MNQIEQLSKYDLAITGEHDGKKGCRFMVTNKGFMPVLDYDKVLDKLNELVEIVNELKTDYEKHLRMHELTER